MAPGTRANGRIGTERKHVVRRRSVNLQPSGSTSEPSSVADVPSPIREQVANSFITIDANVEQLRPWEDPTVSQHINALSNYAKSLQHTAELFQKEYEELKITQTYCPEQQAKRSKHNADVEKLEKIMSLLS
jgi:hypothetical protein